jgi:transposase-like protein
VSCEVASEDRSNKLAAGSDPTALDAESAGLGEGKDPMNQIDRNGTGAASRLKYDETYKRHAVELTLHGDRTVKTVAKELGLPAWQLYDWRKLYAPRPGAGGPAPQTLEEANKEIERLRAEVMRMREREDALKKSLGILSETPERGMPRLRR